MSYEQDCDEHDDNCIIYTVRADGSDRHVIGHGQEIGNGGTWSPDGKWLAYQSDCRDRVCELNTVGTDGSDHYTLGESSSGAPTPLRLSWAPNGQQLAYDDCSFDDFTGDDGDLRCTLNVVRLDSGAVHELNDNYYGALFAWSPDGRWLAFRKPYTCPFEGSQSATSESSTSSSSARPSGSTSDAGPVIPTFGHGPCYAGYTVRADGGPTHALGKDVAFPDAAWAPNGRWLAYTNCHDGCALTIAKPDGSDRHALGTRNSLVDTDGQWLPDGKRLTFTTGCDDHGDRCRIVTIRPDGTEKQRIGRGSFDGWAPIEH